MPQSDSRKNIVLISLDDMIDVVRHREVFGVTIHTPAIDELMERGVTFENAFTASTLCNPSRTAVLSGRSPFMTGVQDNTGLAIFDVIPAEQTLIGQAQEGGWFTAARGKLFHGGASPNIKNYAGPVIDMADWTEGYGARWTDAPGMFPGPLGDSPVPDEEIHDVLTAQWARDFLSDTPKDVPFFLSVGISKPHQRWDVPKEYYELYDREEIVLPEVSGVKFEDLPAHFRNILQHQPETHDLILAGGPDLWGDAIRGYLAAVSFADAQIGKVLDALTENGLWESTTVLLWSDHGFHLGDREIWRKFTLYEEAASVPLVVVDPEIGTPGTRVSTPASTLDIWPTLSGLTGMPAPANPDGFDLAPLMADPDVDLPRHGVITSVYGSISLRTEKSRYTLYPSGEEELFRVGKGKVFGQDVSDRPELEDRLERMRDLMHEEAEALGIRFVETGDTERGTNGGDTFILVGEARGKGGLGDDIYHLVPEGTAVEKPDGGHDTVVIGTDQPWRLPENVEDAVMTSGSEGKLRATAEANTLRGSNMNNEMRGLAGHDSLFGGNGHDSLFGGKGRDSLFGELGNDILWGGGGADSLSGGWGNDELTGGRGPDIFQFRQGDGVDTVTDFEPGRDLISIGYGAEAFQDLTIRAREGGVEVSYGAGADMILLMGVTVEEIDSGSFEF